MRQGCEPVLPPVPATKFSDESKPAVIKCSCAALLYPFPERGLCRKHLWRHSGSLIGCFSGCPEQALNLLLTTPHVERTRQSRQKLFPSEATVGFTSKVRSKTAPGGVDCTPPQFVEPAAW
jgi:hypothetical protein